MKPAAFDYTAPDSLPQALEILAQHGPQAKILAGGQSLIPAMNFRVASPEILVDFNRIADLAYVNQDSDGSLRIGAMTRQRAVERSELVEETCPLIHEVMPHIAHPQIRNRGTMGGSLVHADPAAELPVVMTALDAKFVLSSTSGKREVSAQDFFFGMFMVDARPDEALTEIVVPRLPAGSGSAFMEVARRHGDYAMMGVAAVVAIGEDWTCTSARLVYLNAGDRPMTALKAAGLLIGERPGERVFGEVAEVAASDEIDPYGNVHATTDYQRHLARVITNRALGLAFARAAAAVEN